MPSVYTVSVDPNEPNNAHTYAVEMVGHAKEVLEFGCGHGHVTRVLQERGCEVVGLDHDPVALEDARRYAREVYHVDLNSTEFAEKLPLESFDVLLLGDVLEHLTDPAEILRAARPLLRRNGYIVASMGRHPSSMSPG